MLRQVDICGKQPYVEMKSGSRLQEVIAQAKLVH